MYVLVDLPEDKIGVRDIMDIRFKDETTVPFAIFKEAEIAMAAAVCLAAILNDVMPNSNEIPGMKELAKNKVVFHGDSKDFSRA